MSDRAQRVLDALMEYRNEYKIGYPFQVMHDFLDMYNHSIELQEDYEELTVEEEKQVIKAFLEFAY